MYKKKGCKSREVKSMKAEYNLKGKERKSLVDAIAKITACEPQYKKAPTFEYTVGDFTVDKEGTVISDDADALDHLRQDLAADGFMASDDGTEMQKDDIVISLPFSGFTEEELDKLEQLIASKESLIKAAFGTDDLTLIKDNDRVSFNWFHDTIDADHAAAYTDFVSALANTAKAQKRITAKDKPVSNQKYAFRCFLLKLGFIGDDFKRDRKILLERLSGSSAFKGGADDEISK